MLESVMSTMKVSEKKSNDYHKLVNDIFYSKYKKYSGISKCVNENKNDKILL